ILPLNSSPTTNSPKPSSSSESPLSDPAEAVKMPCRSTVPAYPYSIASPYRKNAEANAPSRKYLTAASWDSSRRRRAKPVSRYSGSDSTSSDTNITSRLFDAGNSIMPDSANVTSGYASVCTLVVVAWARSRLLPTATAAEATSALPAVSSDRSDTSSTLTMPSAASVPSIKRVGPSTAMAPAAVVRCLLRISTTATSAATQPASASGTWIRARQSRGANASISTPAQATPSMISIGDSAAYEIDGA